MNELLQLLSYLESGRDAALRKVEALQADGRRDEAALEKIRANIFDIMATVSRTAQAKFPQDPMAFVREKAETIPVAWRESLAEAEAHADYTKVAIERVKLDTAAEISMVLTRIAEGGA